MMRKNTSALLPVEREEKDGKKRGDDQGRRVEEKGKKGKMRKKRVKKLCLARWLTLDNLAVGCTLDNLLGYTLLVHAVRNTILRVLVLAHNVADGKVG